MAVTRDAHGRVLPGSVLNPKGGPKKKGSLTELLELRLDELIPGLDRTYKQQIVNRWLLALVDPKSKDFKELLKEALDRVEGKAKESVKHEGDPDKPIVHLVRVVYDDEKRI